MSNSVGFGNNSGNVGFTPGDSNKVSKGQSDTALPRLDQGNKDQLIQGDGSITLPPVTGYFAPVQSPQLAKPKSDARGGQMASDSDKIASQKGDTTGSSIELQSEMILEEPPPEQGEEHEGEGEGKGGQKGSDSGSQGSFTGGGNTGGGSSYGGDPGYGEKQMGRVVQEEFFGPIPQTRSFSSTKANPTNDAGVNMAQGTAVPRANATVDGQVNLEGAVQASTVASTQTVGTGQLNDPPKSPLEFYQNTSLLLQEMYADQVKIASTLPDGPEKTRFMDFLKSVNSALIAFQKLLNELQMEDSKGARDRARGQLETVLQKIERQRKERDRLREMSEEQREKEGKLGPINKTFGSLGIVMNSLMLVGFAPLLLAAGPPGWIFLGMMVFGLSSNIMKLSGMEDTLWTYSFSVLDKACEEFVKEVLAPLIEETTGHKMSEGELEIAILCTRWSAVMTICSLVALANPAVFAFGGSATMVDALANSRLVYDTSKTAGNSDSTAMQVEMYTILAAGLASMILSVTVGLVAGVGAAGGMANMANATAMATKTVVQSIIKFIQAAVKVSESVANAMIKIIVITAKILLDPQLWVGLSMLGLKTASTVITVELHELISKMLLIQARLEEDVERKEALIATLKKMIKKLLESMEGIAKDISSISTLIQKNFQGLSEVMTDLHG